MIQIEKTDNELKKFGIVLALLLVVFIYFVIPFIQDIRRPTIVLYFSGAIFALAFFSPKRIRPIYRAWMFLGSLLGWVNTRIILGLLFYFIVFPLGVLLKITGKDFMRTKWDTLSETYREPSEDPDIESLKELF